MAYSIWNGMWAQILRQPRTSKHADALVMCLDMVGLGAQAKKMRLKCRVDLREALEVPGNLGVPGFPDFSRSFAMSFLFCQSHRALPFVANRFVVRLCD